MLLLNKFNGDYPFDNLIKISVVGNSNVGKTNIIQRFTRNIFNLETKSTIGVDFENKIINYKNRIIKTQVWDTAGQERYMSIVSTFYKSAHGIIIVYDITDRSSFQNVEKWIESIKKYININNTKILLLGNKSDLYHKRVVSNIEGREMAEKHKINLFLEISALENIDTDTSKSVDKAFEFLITLILDDIIKEDKNVCPINNSISLSNLNAKQLNTTKTNTNVKINCC